ncbi:MAG: hypothetical protein KAT43_04505 [Nanoarchaeota archaeon]|nr:hypothetical protein [Nanoarchaeota archaeon]
MPGTEWMDEEQKAMYGQWEKEEEGVADASWLISNLGKISKLYCNIEGTVVIDGGRVGQEGTIVTNPITSMTIDKKSLKKWKKESRGLILLVEGDGFQTRIPIHIIELGLAYALVFTPEEKPIRREYRQIIGFKDYLKKTDTYLGE